MFDTHFDCRISYLLNQNGVDIGGNRLFEWLRTNGYLVKRKAHVVIYQLNDRLI